MSIGNYLEDELLDHVFGGGDYTRPATLYISLHTGDPGETGANEVSGGSYGRASVTNNNTNFPAASGGAKANGAEIAFPTPSAGWGTVSHAGVWDASSGGNFLWGGGLTVSKAINSGDDVVIPVGDFDVTLA